MSIEVLVSTFDRPLWTWIKVLTEQIFTYGRSIIFEIELSVFCSLSLPSFPALLAFLFCARLGRRDLLRRIFFSLSGPTPYTRRLPVSPCVFDKQAQVSLQLFAHVLLSFHSRVLQWYLGVSIVSGIFTWGVGFYGGVGLELYSEF